MATTTVRRYIDSRKRNESNSSTEQQQKLQNQISSKVLEAQHFTIWCFAMVERVLRAHGAVAYVVLLGLLLMAAPHQLVGQEIHHTPTIEQCKLIVTVWSHEIHHEDKYSADELSRVADITMGCIGTLKSTDPVTSQKADVVSQLAFNVAARRWASFLVRHGLWDQFIAEDAKGAR